MYVCMCVCMYMCVHACVCVCLWVCTCMHACDMFLYKHATPFYSMSLGGGVDQTLIDALEAAYKDVRFLCLSVRSYS